MDLNDQAIIVLTKCGANILNMSNAGMNKAFPTAGIIWKTDYNEGDTYISTLWEILSIFSECYTAGHDAPFTGLEKL